MKKYTIYLLLASWTMFLAGCYDDKSTLPDKVIAPVEFIVPEAIATELAVVQGKQLDVTGVRIVRDGKVNPEGLTYLWSVCKTENDSEAIELGTSHDFHGVIPMPVSSSGYWFVLTVTDPTTQLFYQYKWKLFVTAEFGEGIAVAYTLDGVTSDLALIAHPKLTKQYAGPETGKIAKDLIKTHNEKPLPTLVKQMLYAYAKTGGINMLWVATADDLLRIGTGDYKIMSHVNDVFVSMPKRLNVQQLRSTYQCTLMLNDGDIYESPLSYNQISLPVPSSVGMKVDNLVLSTHSTPGSTLRPSTIFYDKSKGKFCYGRNADFSYCTTALSGAFNPGDAPNLSSVAGGLSVNGASHTMLMLDEKGGDGDGKYKLYTFEFVSNNSGPKPKLIYSIPAAANNYIRDAVSIFFSRLEPILYIASADGIYKVIFEAGAVIFDPKPVYTPPVGEKITIARLYLQGLFAMESWGPYGTLDWNCRAVVVVTSKDGKNDKLHVIPQINFGSGQLDAAHELAFDGMGRILEVTPTGLYF